LNPQQTNSRLPRRNLLIIAGGLLLLSFVTAYYFKVQPSIEFQQKSLQRYVTRLEKDAADLLQDTALMRRLVLQTETLGEFSEVEAKRYGFFLFAETISEGQGLLFWNNQKILPPAADFSLKDGTYFQRLANGYYVLIKKNILLSGMSNRLIAYILIPVYTQYYLETEYLPNAFVHDADAASKISISEAPTEFGIKSLTGNNLFHIRRVAHTNEARSDTLTIILRLGALVLLLVYVHLLADGMVRRSRALHGILFLSGALLLIRVLLYLAENFFAFSQFELFNPIIYASNWINRSLGDLLINSLFLCWIVLFTWYNISPHEKTPSFLKGRNQELLGGLAIFVLIFSTFQLANVVRALVANSTISFNVTEFFTLDIYTVVGFIVLALVSLTYYYFTRLLFRVIFPAFRNRQLYIYFLIAVVGLVFLTFRTGNDIVLFHLPVLVWLVIYTLLVSQEQFIINSFRATVASVLFWIFVFSMSLSVIILEGNREKELRIRKGIAEKYDQLSDPSGENTMSITIAYLNNRFLLNNFHRFANPRENGEIRDSIIRTNFTAYSRRYDTRLYVFDSLNNAVNNDDGTSFAELNTIFSMQSKRTGIPDLYYHETSFSHYTYITKRVIQDSSRIIGTFFLVSTPKAYGNSDALYPELFRKVNRNDIENSPNYSHAIYKDRLLITSSSKYPFQTTLDPGQVPKSEFEQRENGDYSELWYRPAQSKVVVIARKKESLLESLTLFSYLFCAFLFMVGLLQFISVLLRFANDRMATSIFSQLNIRLQIHGTVIFISALSFLIIGMATISFFIDRYNRNNIDKLSQTAGIMVKEIERSLVSQPGDTLEIRKDADLQQVVKEVAEIHIIDVNIYDLQGNLEYTSDENVYRRGILSSKMHPRAYYHLNRLREVQRVQEESVSSLNYLSIYTVVRDENGQVRKYLNIPYFASQLDLNQEISNFLVTIINLNAFIFLIAGVIALFITNKITQSFSVIGNKMRDITLGKTNEEILWNKNDEIGELVKQYNRMVQELEKSAEALAKSEREGAWREMARQVAHEIKNPLTPMKLSIQYLQKSINSNHANVKELTASVANTLIEQIDHLSKIAADFSQFANIGNKKIELLDLHTILYSLVGLYSTNPKVSIQWNQLPGSLVMKGDKTHMNRLFTNLLANAVDASAWRESCRITIDEWMEEENVVIRVTDNGEGIPEEIRSRIFTPNFTTKTSGTGLGLAMCKNIVEHNGGEIWFETEEGQGTSFYVRLPVIT